MSSSSSITPFASGHTRAKWVTILLAVIILLSVIAVVSDYAEIRLLSRAQVGETITIAEVEANDNRQGIIGVFQLVAYLTTVILFLMWIHRAHKNLSAFGARHLKYSPGWAVGWFFVPFLNLVRPFQVVKEIWGASDSNLEEDNFWRTTAASPLIGWWWALFLISTFADNFAARLYGSGETISELLTGSWVMLVSDGLYVPAALVAILLVRAIDAMQEEKSTRIARLDLLPNNPPVR